MSVRYRKQIIASSGTKVNLNGVDTDDAKFYAPVSAGTSGYTLVADENGVPVWTSGASKVNLNGEDVTDAKFYAPVSGGTSGQTLIASGDGKAPEWKDEIKTIEITNAAYEALSESEKTDPLKMYVITDDGGESEEVKYRTINGNAITGDTNDIKVAEPFTLNGTSGETKPNIYAPTTSGSSGQVLLSKGRNNAPEWSGELFQMITASTAVTIAASTGGCASFNITIPEGYIGVSITMTTSQNWETKADILPRNNWPLSSGPHIIYVDYKNLTTTSYNKTIELAIFCVKTTLMKS